MRSGRSLLGVLVIAVVLGLPLGDVATAAKPNPVCKQCRTVCLESVAACAAADPRLANCSARRQAFCLRRATKACTRNLKKCCRRTCRQTGQLICCGSATSSRPTTTTTLFGATTTTVTGGSTTTTTLNGSDIPCTTDADCATCGCCNLNTNTCSPATGNSGGYCCNITGSPPTPLQPGDCGPNTPATCPAMAVCPPPGSGVGGTRYTCQWCAGSGALIGQFHPSDQPPQSYPSNACMRD